MNPLTSGLSVATNCHHNAGMADWQRLGQRVIARRIALKYRRREDLANAFDGLSLRTLGDIEAGRKQGYHPNTLATLEHALHWEPGSIAALLDGGEATEKPASAGSAVAATPPNTSAARSSSDEAIARVMRDPRIDDPTKVKIVKLLIAERERLERELGERVEAMIQAFRDDA